MRKKERIAAIFTRFETETAHPKTELRYFSPFTLVAAVALSAQATDVGVNKATEKLFADAPDAQSMVALGLEGIMERIKTIGLYRNKAKNLIAMSQIIIDQYQGELPLTREALQSLPGVGRKTASVVLNELGIEPAIAVDTHVFRVAHRLDLSRAKTPDAVEQDLTAAIPKAWLSRAHHWLILHGRYVCQARKPRCAACLIADLCPSRQSEV